MSFTALFLALLCLRASVHARPSTIPIPDPLVLRENFPSARSVTSSSAAALTANVYICEHINWGGNCINVPYNIASGDCVPLDGTASSIRPDKGFSCTFYKNVSCRTFDGSGTLKLRDPGSADLTREEGGWNDAARGFQCYKV